MLRITKYTNRRLYNPDLRCYITLSDVYDLVRSKTEFIVIDKVTGRDRTCEVMFDVLKAREIAKPKLTPSELAQLIRA